MAGENTHPMRDPHLPIKLVHISPRVSVKTPKIQYLEKPLIS
jgi:hypothetical protein